MNKFETRVGRISEPLEAEKTNVEYSPAMLIRRVNSLHKIITETYAEPRPDFSEFKGIYKDEEIAKDTDRLTKKEEEIEKKLKEKIEKILKEFGEEEAKKALENEIIKKKLSEAMEVLVYYFGDDGKWFGSDATMAQTSKYDDLFGGADLVLHFKSEKEPVALKIDVTTSADISDIDKKLNRCKNKVVSQSPEDRLIKYYKSPLDGSCKSIKNVIPFVIGFDKLTVLNLMEKTTKQDELTNKKNQDKTDKIQISFLKNEILTHPAQMIMLKQMSLQISYYEAELKKRGGYPPEYLAKISTVAKQINKVFEEKSDRGIRIDKDDPVLKRIENKIKNMYEEI